MLTNLYKKLALLSFLFFAVSTFGVVNDAAAIQIAKENSVIVYGTSWCGYCKKTKEYLHSLNVTFTFYDIEHSEIGKRKYEKLEVRGVPIIIIGSQRIEGFDANAIKQALQAQGLLK